MGEFVADPWCHYDFCQILGVAFLGREDYRPDVIILPIRFPSSIDNAIFDLAWGLASHKLSSHSYSMSPSRVNKETKAQAEKLVRKVEAQVTKERVRP
jgi:hypothetical protein